MADIFTKEKRGTIMGRIKGKDTKPEIVVRSLLHKNGYRFRLHNTRLPGKPDIPQTRKRVFIYGIRKDLKHVIRSKWPPEITHGDPDTLEVKMGLLKLYKKAKSVFSLPLLKDDQNNVHMQHSDELIEVFKSTPKNGGSRADSSRVLPCHKDHNGHKDVYGRINPDKPGPTMTTSCTNPSKGRFVHPTQHHGITVRHAARFQTFPDNFIFSGELSLHQNK